VPSGNSSYTVTVKHGATGNTSGGWLGSGGYGTSNAVNAFRRSGTDYLNYWWANDFSSTNYADNQTFTWKYDNTLTSPTASSTLYVNTTAVATMVRSNRASTTINNTIGVTNTTEYLNGQVYSIYIYPSSLSDTNRALIEA
jgi:hypothetical protein